MYNLVMDYSYIAGFIDADGSIGLRENGYPHLVVANTDREPLDAMREWTGEGRIVSHDRGKHRVLHYWDMSGVAAQNVLKNVVSLLIIKRKRAEYGLTWIPKGPGTPKGQPWGNGSTVGTIRVGDL